MHIIYAAATCTNRVYKQLFEHSKVKPAYQSQKYHRLMIEGFAANARVDVVAIPPVNRSCMVKPFVRLPVEECGAVYHHLMAVANPYLKALVMFVGTFWHTFRLAGKDSAVVVDCLNRVISTAAIFASKLRGRRCVGIVMDLPDMFSYGGRFYKAWGNWIIRQCTDYVFLTEAMNDYVNAGKKPYVVLEGQSDISMVKAPPSMDKKIKPRVVMYAGGFFRQYGADILTEGFLKAKLPDVQLHIYGPGDYVDEFVELSCKNSQLHYGGVLMNFEMEEKEQEATLLVNPRPTYEEYVKYSFPSKIMEYMASGTPVLTTRLPGIPKEYEPYLMFIDDEDSDGIACALKKVFGHSDEELFAMGCSARDYVLECRNNIVQAQKILDMVQTKR